ncbi:hypothetical protein F5Y03DRAFT_7431 [Xylaria venustula]|nr:hypothetical protein F5Y03DRAFT_7431 [Xylaria venustula]
MHLVAFAVVLSAFVHWAVELSTVLWAVPVIVPMAFKLNVPLFTAMILFIIFLVLLLAFFTRSYLFVFAVLFPSVIGAYTGKISIAFGISLLVYHVWMTGLRGVVTFSLQALFVAGLKLLCSFPESHADAWPSILRSLNIDLEPILACYQAYQAEIHPPILFLFQYLFHFIEMGLYVLDQAAKSIVWAFTQNYNWRPDWKVKEHARIRAEALAERLRNKVPPAVARRQREEAQRLWHQREQQAQVSAREVPYESVHSRLAA